MSKKLGLGQLLAESELAHDHARDFRALPAPEQGRLQYEAARIVRGRTAMLPTHEHLAALWVTMEDYFVEEKER